MVVLLTITGLTTFAGMGHALLAPLGYLAITMLQNNVVSPFVYAGRLKLNPLAVMICVLFGWFIWGVAGVFLAIPIAATLKALGDQVPRLAPLGKVWGIEVPACCIASSRIAWKRAAGSVHTSCPGLARRVRKGGVMNPPLPGDPLRVQQIGVVFLATAVAAIALAATARVDGPQTGAPPRFARRGRRSGGRHSGRPGRAKLDDGSVRESPSSRRTVWRLQRVLPAAEIAGYGVSLDSLISQLGRQERAPALQSANRLSRAIVGFMGKYDVIVPSQVRLSGCRRPGRIYAAETGRWPDASAAAEELRANYAGVGTHVAGKDSTLDRRVRQQLTQLDRAVAAKSAARVRAIATALLDDVDLVEQTY